MQPREKSVSKPQIFYVAGYGRSGSTILDMLLGMHPGIIGMGELTNIFSLWDRDQMCSCGKVFKDCSFWGVIIDQYCSTFPDISFKKASIITRKVEATPVFHLRSILRSSTLLDNYKAIWTMLITSIAEVADALIIVDSSKTTRITWRRLLALSVICDFELKSIHLVRDPRSVVWSLMKGSNQKLEKGLVNGESTSLWGRALKGIIGWVMANSYVHVLETVYKFPTLRLSYEDLVNNPKNQLICMEKAFDIDLNPVKVVVENNYRLDCGHGVAGNRLRRKRSPLLTPKNEWERLLPIGAKFIALVGWPLSRLYGYEMRWKDK